MIHGGTLNHGPGQTRVVAIANHRLLAAIMTGANGRWSLDTEVAPEWIVAQRRQTAVAAAAAAPADAAQLHLPELVELELEQAGAVPHMTVWVDPVELAGLPHELIWSLFAEPDQVVALHVAELVLPPRGKSMTIPVQRGRFRLSGGTISLRPSIGADPWRLAGVTNLDTGIRIEGQAGLVIIDIQGPARYRLDFESYH